MLNTLLNSAQKASLIHASLTAQRTPGPFTISFDARYGWDFRVYGSHESPSIIFSVSPDSERFGRVLRELHRAVVDFRSSHASEIRGLENC
jgi:hypothetical protein